MPIILSKCLIFLEAIIISDCAPKLGPLMIDPLLIEANETLAVSNYEINLNNNTIKRNIQRSVKENSKEVKKKSCLGYEYDETKCRHVNSRILCGYNKNIGEIKRKDQFIDLGNGCRIHRDRIECGYIIGPFKSFRWPSVDSSVHKELNLITTGASKQVKENKSLKKILIEENKESEKIITEKSNLA
ncbi:uncharacterized protein LOC116413078 [Galleria mellonella]|uniref:Uncharacterized protein LOC116413078 n=1 Tax=Galleria mellonella TaxID=7137 RepID=A0A6J3C4G9_GALME|nr:uncharacterized protein LOC116413078 [Galleria mellonella]